MKPIHLFQLIMALLLNNCGLNSTKQIKITPDKTYDTIKIGKQVWMVENLSVTKFRNGDEIPLINNCDEWCIAFYNKMPACCYLDDDTLNRKSFGLLYNWYAVNDNRGLAPKGWKIPYINDWNENIFSRVNRLNGFPTSIYQVDLIEFPLIIQEGHYFKYSESNEKLGGGRSGIGSFYNPNEITWWSATEVDYESAFEASLEHRGKLSIVFFPSTKGSGAYIRCIRDKR